MQHGDVLNELPVSNGSRRYIDTINRNNDNQQNYIHPADENRY